KTTFALLWLALYSQEYDYWKPLETGDSDTATIRRLLPDVQVHPPVLSLRQAVAPPLAARAEGVSIPQATELAARRPALTAGRRSLLVETFGSPFSPLNARELQITLIQRLQLPLVLISSSLLGAIGRTLQCLYALQTHALRPAAVVLLGPRDDYAVA